MERFILILGWVALIGAPVITLAVILISILEGFELHMIVRLVLMPFVFLWGLRQVRSNRLERTDN